MRRRNFVKIASPSILATAGLGSVIQQPVIGIDFNISVPNKNPQNVESISISFSKFNLNTRYLDESEKLEIVLSVEVDTANNQQTRKQILSLSSKKSFAKSDLQQLYPVIIDGINTTKSSINGNVTITVSHPDIEHKTYTQKFSLYDKSTDVTFTNVSEKQSYAASKGSIEGVDISSNGKHIFYASESNEQIVQLTLGTPFDLTTVTNTKSIDLVRNIEGMEIGKNGENIYYVEDTTQKLIHYSLSTPFDISTATHENTVDISESTDNLEAVGINEDGSKIFIADRSDGILQYQMTRTHDITSLDYEKTKSVPSPWGLAFNLDGTKMYVTDINGRLRDYNLSTQYDVGSITEESDIDSSSLYGINDPRGVGVGDEVDSLFVADYDTDKLFKFS